MPMPNDPSSCAPKTLCRRTKRGDERCERVTAVAAQLFLERGYDGVSLDDIIAQAGGSKTNIYSRFGGKEGLFLTVVEQLCDEITSHICAVDVGGLSFEEGLRRLGRSLLENLLQERALALYRLVIGESRRFPALGCAWTTHGPEAFQHILATFIARHKTAPSHMPADEAAVLFHNMVVTHHLDRAVFGLEDASDPARIARTIDNAMTLFEHGYA